MAVTAGQFVAVTDITAGLLKFTPAANASGAACTSFTFQVEDDGGTVNGGSNLDPSPKTMTVNVTALGLAIAEFESQWLDPKPAGDEVINGLDIARIASMLNQTVNQAPTGANNTVALDGTQQATWTTRVRLMR